MSSELPRGWVATTLGDVADFVMGQAPPGADCNTDGTGTVFVKAGEFGPIRPFVKEWTTKPLKMGSRGDVFICVVGATAGKLNLGIDCAIGRSVAAIRPHGDLTSEFLLMQLTPMVPALRANSVGSAQGVISREDLAEIRLVLPPLAEQKRIVAKIEELTARSRRAKEALDAVPPLLDQLRQSILAAAFRGDLTADWRAKNPNVEPAEKLIARIRAERRARWEADLRGRGKDPAQATFKEPAWVDAEGLPNLPEGWSWAPAEFLVEPGTVITYGIVLPGKHVKDGVPYVRQQDIRGGAIDVARLLRTTREIAAKYERSSLREGDVLLCIIRHRRVAIVPAGLNGANVTQGTVRFRPCSSLERDYLASWLESPVAQQWMQARVFGLDMPRINVEDTREIPVPLAPKEEQRRIVALLRSARARLDGFSAAHTLATNLVAEFDHGLLAKAFRGELVPQDPSDEPASALLERIRAARDTGEAGARARRSRRGEKVAEEPDEVDGGNAPAHSLRSTAEGRATKDISALDQQEVQDEVFAALWPRGPLEKDEAVRLVAEHLREAGYVQFQRLRSDGPLYAQCLEYVESAVKAGRLERPKRGQVRACKHDATTFTADDWRHALLASLGTDPTHREDAIRVAAEWARDNLGLEFSRLRSDGHIVEGLRSAINSAIRRGEVTRHDATRISRAGNGHHRGQLAVTVAAPRGDRHQTNASGSHDV